jgi:HEPN domain-containing protein
VERLLSLRDHEAAGVYLQQAVEKFLKAFLLFKGWQLERIHDLEALLNRALTYDPALESFRPSCQKITGFYSLARSPFSTEAGMTEDDVRQSLEQVKGLIERILREVRP